MVKKNGAYFMKTAQEREVEKRTEELMEEYRARQKEMKETFTTTNVQNTESQRSFRSVEDYSRPLERRRGEGRDAMDKRVDESQVYKGHYSSAAPERQTYSELDGKQVKRTPSFTLNAGKSYFLYLMSFTMSKSMVRTCGGLIECCFTCRWCSNT